MEEALLGDDRANKKGHHRHDRHGLHADAVEVMHDGAQSKSARMQQSLAEGRRKTAEHGGEIERIDADGREAAAERLKAFRKTIARRRRQSRARQPPHFVDQAALRLRDAGQRRLRLAAQPHQHIGAEHVETLYAGQIECGRRRSSAERIERGLHGVGVVGDPGARRHEAQACFVTGDCR